MNETSPSIVVLGSLHYDIMMDAPDRPRKGETVTGRSWRPKCGGKGGNQAVAAARQGASTRMIGAVGSDDFGDALLANLDRAGVDRTGVAILEGAASGMSVAIFDDEGDYGAVIVSGSILAIAPGQCGESLLRDSRVLVLQNEVPEDVNQAATAAARRLGIRTILYAAPARAFATDLPSLVSILVQAGPAPVQLACRGQALEQGHGASAPLRQRPASRAAAASNSCPTR